MRLFRLLALIVSVACCTPAKAQEAQFIPLFLPPLPTAPLAPLSASKIIVNEPSLVGIHKNYRHLRFSGPVNETSAKRIIQLIEDANAASNEYILLEINSPGGLVAEGWEIVRAIETSKVPVYCVVDGEAASMASFFLQACPRRYMTRRSSLMIHRPAPSGSVQGDENLLRDYVEGLRTLTDAMTIFYSSRMKTSLEEIRRKIDGHQWWLNADEALTAGAVDALVVTVSDVTPVTIAPQPSGKTPSGAPRRVGQ